MPAAIRFENVNFSYEIEDGQEQDVFAETSVFSLENINFAIEEGEFVAVLGHNGSGKSTLARLCNGLLKPTAGTITALDMPVHEEKNLFEIRKSVGIVFQNPDNQTVASIVEDDIAFGPENVGVPREEIGKRIDFALNAVGMQEYRFSTTSRLSGGQKQRIAIAGVLALKPRVMILDEATAMLDPRGRKEVMDVVLRLNKEEKITVLLITHFPEEALLADRAIVMNGGKIVMQGKPEEILKRNDLKQSSLTLPRGIKLCRALQENGVPVADAFSFEEVANSLANLFQDKQTTGAGLRSMNIERQEIKPKAEEGAVVCEHLSYTYNESSPFATAALKNVNLCVPSGCFFGIIGHTGSGKSTFLQHLNALIKLPTAEKKYKEKRRKKNKDQAKNTTVLNVNTFDLTKKTTDFTELRKKVGVVFQYPEYQLFAETVFDDVAFGLRNFYPEWSEAQMEIAVKEAIETVGLCYGEVKNRSPFELSGGQRRRVAIAGVIVTRPEILILDEPAAGLDPLGKEEIMSLLHSVHGAFAKTVIIVSHDMDEIAENCDLAAVFSEGEVIACAPPKSLFLNEEVCEKAGLELPFIAKVSQALQAKGVCIENDFTWQDFAKNVVQTYRLTGAGLRLNQEGGQNNA